MNSYHMYVPGKFSLSSGRKLLDSKYRGGSRSGGILHTTSVTEKIKHRN